MIGFIIFPIFLLLWLIKRFLEKGKHRVNGLVFKIDAINGKKWVKFVAMQQNGTILIYDLKIMKGTGRVT